MRVATPRERAATATAWTLYVLVVLEILFMISPFAAYYYSLYAPWLNALQNQPFTAWLTMYVLPHYSYTTSVLANVLLLVAWPLILIGLGLFLIAFGQIYWAKLRRKGAVQTGLYRWVRHPQYVALAIVGLGTTLYWSRLVVVLAYVSMLFAYYFLAEIEERRCAARFGDAYREYAARTGRFLPRLRRHRTEGSRPEGSRRALRIVAGYAFTIAGALALATLLRGYVLEGLLADARGQRVTLFLSPLEPELEARTIALLAELGLPEPSIAYVAPAGWHVPELGLGGDRAQEKGELQEEDAGELLRPSSHGNPIRRNPARVTVVVGRPRLLGGRATGLDVLARALGVTPISSIELDLAKDEVVRVGPAPESKWKRVPVPTF